MCQESITLSEWTTLRIVWSALSGRNLELLKHHDRGTGAPHALSRPKGFHKAARLPDRRLGVAVRHLAGSQRCLFAAAPTSLQRCTPLSGRARLRPAAAATSHLRGCSASSWMFLSDRECAPVRAHLCSACARHVLGMCYVISAARTRNLRYSPLGQPAPADSTGRLSSIVQWFRYRSWCLVFYSQLVRAWHDWRHPRAPLIALGVIFVRFRVPQTVQFTAAI